MISTYHFGKICINGIWYKHDLMIFGNRIIPDWWRKNGHTCDIEDIEVLIKETPDILILGQGTPGMMQATQELQQLLHHKGIKFIEQPTYEAVVSFNNLYKKHNIAAGFHLTC